MNKEERDTQKEEEPEKEVVGTERERESKIGRRRKSKER